MVFSEPKKIAKMSGCASRLQLWGNRPEFSGVGGVRLKLWVIKRDHVEPQTFKAFASLGHDTPVTPPAALLPLTAAHSAWINRELSDPADPQGSHQWRSISNSGFISLNLLWSVCGASLYNGDGFPPSHEVAVNTAGGVRCGRESLCCS